MQPRDRKKESAANNKIIDAYCLQGFEDRAAKALLELPSTNQGVIITTKPDELGKDINWVLKSRDGKMYEAITGSITPS